MGLCSRSVCLDLIILLALRRGKALKSPVSGAQRLNVIRFTCDCTVPELKGGGGRGGIQRGLFHGLLCDCFDL